MVLFFICITFSVYFISAVVCFVSFHVNFSLDCSVFFIYIFLFSFNFSFSNSVFI